MALLDKDGKYIIINDGNFIIFSSLEEREKFKNATSSENIIKKYNVELNKLLTQIKDNGLFNITESEKNYKLMKKPSLQKLLDDFDLLSKEYQNYLNDLDFKKGAQHDFTIMKQYIKDVDDSIPNVIETGFIFNCEDYEKAKERKIFGETKDI